MTRDQIDRLLTEAAIVGQAIAHDVQREGLPREWTGLDPQDADRLVAMGGVPGSPQWELAEVIAARVYRETLGIAAEVPPCEHNWLGGYCDLCGAVKPA